MEQGLSIFANFQTLLVGMCIYVLTASVRRVVETAWSGAKINKWWQEIFLPLGPIGSGLIVTFLVRKTFPWPPPIADSNSAIAMYGMVCGVSCGWLYSRVRSFMKSGVPVDNSEKPEGNGAEL